MGFAKRIISTGKATGHADFKPFIKLMNEVEEAINDKPINYDKINEILFRLTSPNFQYPHVEKCCNDCTAPERTIEWKNAIDQLKLLEGVYEYEELVETYEKSRLCLLGGD